MTNTEPIWLTAKLDQRVAQLEQSIGKKYANLADSDLDIEVDSIMLLLTDPPFNCDPRDITRWERTCDACGKYCHDREPFYTGHVHRTLRSGVPLILTLGVCEAHRF